MRIIFFDVDGTLSSPCYNVDGKLQIGMSDEKWAWYCDHYREDAYRWCKPVPQVKDYAIKAKAAGAKLYVLTTSGTQIETIAKKKFLDEKYPGIFDNVYSVLHDDDKCPFILNKAAQLNATPQECELVEDTYRILLQTVVAGIKSTHISTILTMDDNAQ